MPPINRYECDVCALKLPSGWGGCAYVTDFDGNRVTLPHPAEERYMAKILGISENVFQLFDQPKWWWPKKRKADYATRKQLRDAAYARTGFISFCICTDCLEQQGLDLEKDERKCLSCSSANVKSIKEILGSLCPSCKQGTIIEIETGIVC